MRVRFSWVSWALVCLTATSAAAQERMPEAAVLGREARDAIDEALRPDAGPDDADGGPEDTADAGPVDAGPVELAPSPEEIAEQAAAREAARAELLQREAEEAQMRALQESRAATSALLEQLLTRRAGAEGITAKLAAIRVELQRDLEDAATQTQEAKAEAEKARTDAASASADKAKSSFGPVLQGQRAALSRTRSFSAKRARAVADRVDELIATLRSQEAARIGRIVDDENRKRVEEAITELQQATARADETAESLTRDAADGWLDAANLQLGVAQIFNEARLTLIKQMAPADRRSLTGLNQRALDNLQIALEHLRTTVSFHFFNRFNDALSLPEKLRDPLYAGNLAWALLKLALVLIGLFIAWRRLPAIYERSKRAALSSVSNRARFKLIDNVLAIIEDTAPQAALLGAALWARSVLHGLGPEPELSTLFGVFIWIMSYQLAAKLTHRLILRLVRRKLSIPTPMKLKIIRTVRHVMRFAFVAAWVLASTRALVGAGVLYSIMKAVVTLAAAVAFTLLVRQWRTSIVNAYLKRNPDARLARLIEQHRDRWFSFPLAVAALGFVAGRALVTLIRDFVLGFEQTRKALAYLFQVRVERQAKGRNQRAVDVEALPEKYREAFRDEPCTEPRFLVDRFADIEALAKRMQTRPVNALVTCPAGGGLTTWLLQLEQKLEIPVVRVTPEARWRNAADVRGALARALDTDEEHLFEHINGLGHAVFFVDEIERTFLRGLNGYAALNELTDIMAQTESESSWVVGGHRLAISFLERVRGLSSAFDARVELAPWAETEIRELIERRQRSTGLACSFEDLLVQSDDLEADTNRLVETHNGYLRLLWSLADGNPRVVLHFWLRSLRQRGDELVVQLHDAPTPDDLEALAVSDRFLLQGVVLHRAITDADLARVVNLPVKSVRAHVARGLERGLYETAGGQLSVTTHYWSAATRYLKRKNLL